MTRNVNRIIFARINVICDTNFEIEMGYGNCISWMRVSVCLWVWVCVRVCQKTIDTNTILRRKNRTTKKYMWKLVNWNRRRVAWRNCIIESSFKSCVIDIVSNIRTYQSLTCYEYDKSCGIFSFSLFFDFWTLSLL